MAEPGDLGQPQSPHHGLGRLVEYSGHRPDLVQADAVERHRERGPGRLGGVAVMPGVPSEPPANLDAPGTGHAVRHRVEPGEADELARLGDLQRPQPVSLLVEPHLNAVDQRVAGRPVKRPGKEPHRLGVGVEDGERRAVGLQPAPHDQPVRADRVEPDGLGHRGPPGCAGRRGSRMTRPASAGRSTDTATTFSSSIRTSISGYGWPYELRRVSGAVLPSTRCSSGRRYAMAANAPTWP